MADLEECPHAPCDHGSITCGDCGKEAELHPVGTAETVATQERQINQFIEWLEEAARQREKEETE
jgi:hypothetical protein